MSPDTFQDAKVLQTNNPNIPTEKPDLFQDTPAPATPSKPEEIKIKVNQQYKSLNHNPNLSDHRLKMIIIQIVLLMKHGNDITMRHPIGIIIITQSLVKQNGIILLKNILAMVHIKQ